MQGVGLGDLRKGPGHYPETPLPGEQGNAAIAGHRTTYGAPFNRLGELVDGDELQVTTLKGIIPCVARPMSRIFRAAIQRDIIMT